MLHPLLHFGDVILTHFLLVDVEDVIDMAKRKLEKERELFMSKSLPGGYAPDGNQAAENDSDSDDDSDESDEKGRHWRCGLKSIALQ